MIVNPNKTSDTIAVAHWVYDIEAAGHRFYVPGIADYEVRRELVRAGKSRSIVKLNAFNAAEPDRFMALTTAALLLGGDLWAGARNAGTTTADPKELDGDVLIAAQALDMGLASTDFIIATSNNPASYAVCAGRPVGKHSAIGTLGPG